MKRDGRDGLDDADEQLLKSLFIFRGKRDSLRGAESFLRNRGWTVDSSSDLREGIADLLNMKPAYVLVCVEQVTAGLRALPRLLQQALGSRLVLFVEGNPAIMTSFAQEIGCPYMLFPPVSGPSIERMIWRIQRDERRDLAEGASRRNAAAISAERAKEELVSYLRATGSASADPSSAHVLGNFSSEPKNPNQLVEKSSSFHLNQLERPSAQAPASGAPNRDESDRFARSPGVADDAGSYPARGPAPAGAVNTEQGGPARTTRVGPPTHDQKGWSRTGAGSDSIFVTGTDSALELARRQARDTVVVRERVRTATRLGCIDIKSARFSGYLLIAWGADRPLDEAMMRSLRTRLVEFMRARGETFDADDALRLHLREVTFETWAVEQAEFLRKSNHDGHEIAIAFFPTRAKELRVEPAARADMVHVGIDDLKGDAKVEFDVYLHLPANGKYILYTPEGQKFYQTQKDRLKAKGVKRMHLKKHAANDLRRYHVQNFLNERIAECRAAASAAA